MATEYGGGQVTIGPHLIGHVAVTNVTAVPALSPRIRFGLSWTLGHRHRSGEASPPGDEYRLIDFEGELRVGAGDLFVGTLVRDESRHPIRSLAYVQTQGGSVALDLDGHRLERLEEHRAGGVLTMKMQLWGTVNLLRPEGLSGGGRSKLLRQP